MKEINLNRGYKAVVDEEDFGKVSQFKWHVQEGVNTVYARRNYRALDGKQVNQRMHRFILDLPPGTKPSVDHKDGDGLNNRRENLRVCTSAENARNQPAYKNKSSKFKGVIRRPGGKWEATITVDGKHKYVGWFMSEELAARAYDVAATENFGQFARLNFPASVGQAEVTDPAVRVLHVLFEAGYFTCPQGKLEHATDIVRAEFESLKALGRAEGLSDALKIIREYTYLDGRAGEMANLLEDRIEAIRALKEKV